MVTNKGRLNCCCCWCTLQKRGGNWVQKTPTTFAAARIVDHSVKTQNTTSSPTIDRTSRTSDSATLYSSLKNKENSSQEVLLGPFGRPGWASGRASKMTQGRKKNLIDCKVIKTLLRSALLSCCAGDQLLCLLHPQTTGSQATWYMKMKSVPKETYIVFRITRLWP